MFWVASIGLYQCYLLYFTMHQTKFVRPLRFDTNSYSPAYRDRVGPL